MGVVRRTRSLHVLASRKTNPTLERPTSNTERRQFCTPHLLTDGLAKPLERIDVFDKAFDEYKFQQFLFDHPSLLPVGKIEPLFDGLVPLARELPTPVGPIDLILQFQV